MTSHWARSVWGVIVSWGATLALAAEPDSDQRSVTFELTYRLGDLVWSGDPVSPTAVASPKPGAQPVELDVEVRRLVTSPEPIRRHYLTESRTAKQPNGSHTVFAFTREREKEIGTIDAEGRFQANDLYSQRRDLLSAWPEDPRAILVDKQTQELYLAVDRPGPHSFVSLDYLPLDKAGTSNGQATGFYQLAWVEPTADAPQGCIELRLVGSTFQQVLASVKIPKTLPRGSELASFDNRTGTYLTEALYRMGGTPSSETNPSVTFRLEGEWLAARPASENAPRPTASSGEIPVPKITIDGSFEDWRNISGVDDPLGDTVSYLDYVPDVDLLEFKVAHDDEHLYLYARVAGQVGRTSLAEGRSYFYAYIDVDQNPETGFIPSRDDECYFGVPLGDDCEVQFEFVNNALRKTFYGFCGKGGNERVLKQQVTLGKSQYGRLDDQGRERADYKAEYIFRQGRTEITEDLKLGTSDSIRLALSPDGREVEIASQWRGFLRNERGELTLQPGRAIDIAAGMECDSSLYPTKRGWGADNTRPIRGYHLTPASKR